MEQMDRTEGLRALIRQGLQAVAHKDTLAHLGDRSSYIGMVPLDFSSWYRTGVFRFFAFNKNRRIPRCYK